MCQNTTNEAHDFVKNLDKLPLFFSWLKCFIGRETKYQNQVQPFD